MRIPSLVVRFSTLSVLVGLLATHPVGATSVGRMFTPGLVQESQAVAVDQFGNLVVGGIARAAGANHDDGLLVWVTPDGAVSGGTRISTTAHERIHACVRSAGLVSGTFYGGSVSSVTPSNDQAWMGRVDEFGALGWQMLYGGIGQERIRGLSSTAETLTGVGYTTSLGIGSEDGLVLNVNEWNGGVQSTWTYGGTNADRFAAVARPASGGFILVGRTFSFGATAGDAWVVRVDAGGVIQWQTRFGGSAFEEATAVRATTDGGFIIAGTTTSYGPGCSDGFLIKLNANGAPQWASAYGTPAAETATSVIEVGGRFILAGTTEPEGCASNYGPDAWLLEVDALGNIISSAAHGSPTVLDRFDALDLLHDGALALAGTTGVLPQKDLFVGRLTACAEMENPCARPVDVTRTPFQDWMPTTGLLRTNGFPVVVTTTGALLSHGLGREANCLRYSRTFEGFGKSFGSTLTLEGGFAVAGSAIIDGARAALVAAYSPSGDQRMVSTHRLAGFELQPLAIVELPDFGFVVGGIAWATLNASDQRGFLLRVAADGDFTWARLFSEAGIPHSVTAVTGGADGFVGVMGLRESTPRDTWVARVEVAGGGLAGGWQTFLTRGVGTDCHPGGIVQDGNRYLAAGYSLASGGSFWIQEVDATTGVATPITAGNVSGSEQISSIALTGTGNDLLIAGSIDGNGWAARWDLTTTTMDWSKMLTPSAPAIGLGLGTIAEVPGGGLAAFGDVWHDWPPAGSYIDGWIGRLAADGTFGGARRYGGSQEDHVWSGVALPSGDLVGVGEASSFSGTGLMQGWILKTAPDGTISPACSVVNDTAVVPSDAPPAASTSPTPAPASVVNDTVSSTSAAGCTPMEQQCP